MHRFELTGNVQLFKWQAHNLQFITDLAVMRGNRSLQRWWAFFSNISVLASFVLALDVKGPAKSSENGTIACKHGTPH